MSDLDGEIEYLEEDEDIVQQCVQAHVQTAEINLKNLKPIETQRPVSLLVERKEVSKKRKFLHESSDEDYNPSEELKPVKKKLNQYSGKSKSHSKQSTSLSIHSPAPKKQDLTIKDLLKKLRNDFSIPDYEDPLCLPVKSLKKDDLNRKRLRSWNKLCLSYMKKCEEPFYPKTGKAVSSNKTVVFRKTNKTDISVWTRVSVVNKDDEKKSEVLQCVLPSFREKTVLDFQLLGSKKRKSDITKETVLLTKEDHNNKQALVVFKPNMGLSSVYNLVEEENPDGPTIRSVSSVSTVLSCPRCYQTSWRPTREKSTNNVICPICHRTFQSVYNFLSHSKTHDSKQVRAKKDEIGEVLAKIVDYHYKCRICQSNFNSIKETKMHVEKHKTREKIMCEIGNHWTQ